MTGSGPLEGLDDEVVVAAVDLIGRTGARECEIGFLEDTPPHHWYATAKYRGARITEADHDTPVAACMALAQRLLTGAKCTTCGRLVALSPEGAFAYQDGHLVDGSRWTVAEATRAGQCLWRRRGRRWSGECEQRAGMS